MDEGMARKWARIFSDARENIHDKDNSIADHYSTKISCVNVNENVHSNRLFKILDWPIIYPNISRFLLHDIVSEHLHYKKLFSAIQKLNNFACYYLY